MRILLIEDSAGDAKLIRLALQESGSRSELIWVDRLAKGLEQLARNPFDVILLDLGLPDSLGIEGISQIRQITRETPIIILTGNLDKDMALSALRKGAEDYLEKGVYTSDSLIRAIQYSVERKKTEKTIQEQERALFSASKLMALGELTAFIFHEIRNPLCALSMNTELLDRYINGNGPIDRETLHRLLASSHRNIRGIDKILDGLQRSVDGSAQEPFEEVQLADLFSGTVELCLNRFRSSQVSLQVEGVSQDLKLACRPTQITQVLVNLLNNAFDAVGSLEKKWVKLEVMDQPEFTEISVTDSGNGISEELSKKILETFFTTKPKGKGTGLGLSISKRIVEEHGGRFFIDHGCANTRFVARFPKRQMDELGRSNGVGLKTDIPSPIIETKSNSRNP